MSKFNLVKSWTDISDPYVSKLVKLTNRMWFSGVYSFIDNDTLPHSGQNVVDSRGAAE